MSTETKLSEKLPGKFQGSFCNSTTEKNSEFECRKFRHSNSTTEKNNQGVTESVASAIAYVFKSAVAADSKSATVADLTKSAKLADFTLEQAA